MAAWNCEYYAFASTQGDSGGPFSGCYVCTSGICNRGIPMPGLVVTDTIRMLACVPADTPAATTEPSASLPPTPPAAVTRP
ncbi:MAG: hypothetical protein R2873_06775 [Caldilineaceae bacterium]